MKDLFPELTEQIKSGTVIPIPDFLSRWLEKRKQLYLNGQWIDGETSFTSFHPGDGSELAQVTAASRAQIDLAVRGAKDSFDAKTWAGVSISERARALHKIADLIDSHRAPLALLESLDTGKPIRESYDGDIARAAYNFRFYADFASAESWPSYHQSHDDHYTEREPLGVIALVTPWNLPLYLATWKIAPALVMGNSIVLKPSELTPLTAQYFTEIISQVDLPRGVFQLVHGFGEGAAGEWLCSHPDISAISFTGETDTGKAIMRSASQSLARLSFEMGGKGASVVFQDAPYESALQSTLRAAFRNQGEICLACPRVFVEKPIYEKFVGQFVEAANKIRVGNPLSWNTEMGALISEDHRNKVSGYLSEIGPDGSVLTCGTIPDELDSGYFLSPIVISGLSLAHPISQKEIFGPVVSIYPFESETQVTAAVNDTPYGLSSSIWTHDLAKAKRVASALRIGLVWINTWFQRDLRVPFGGQKKSGLGREGGRHSLDFYSDWKSLCFHREV